MKEIEFITAWLMENYPDKRYFLRPIQRHFDEQLKNYRNNVIYYGLFSGDVSVLSPFQQAPIQINETHTRPFIFSHLSATSSVEHTFIGWEISFLDLIIQHDFLPPVTPDEIFQANLIYIRLGGCSVTDTNLFTLYHKNGVVFNEIECLTPFNGVNETYSFSYDMVHFYSCNISSLGVVDINETCEVPVDSEPPTLPVSWWQAIHPDFHPMNDRVVYLDSNGDEQTHELSRTNIAENNPCERIDGIVTFHIGAVPCEPLPVGTVVLNAVHNGVLNYTITGDFTINDFNVHLTSDVYGNSVIELIDYHGQSLAIEPVYYVTLHHKTIESAVSNTVFATASGGL